MREPHERTVAWQVQREDDRQGLSRGQPLSLPRPGEQRLARRGGAVPETAGFSPSTVDTGGVYRLGAPQRPPIVHDAGFSTFPPRAPTWQDHAHLAVWRAILATAEATRPDLVDACGAYRHYLDGKGRSRVFDFERYVQSDSSGWNTLAHAVLEAQHAAITLWQAHGRSRFSFTGPEIPCGADKKRMPNTWWLYPQPLTENWMKAIGGYSLWLSGDVAVVDPGSAKPFFSLQLTLHAEDQYNFNPGQADYASGVPDDANGRFVVTGLAHGYRHESVLRRNFAWRGTDLGVPQLGIPATALSRIAQDHSARGRLSAR